MAIKIMAMEITNNYSSYAAQGMVGSGAVGGVKKKEIEKTQKDPKQEKEMKELIKGVESVTKLLDGIRKASGWTVVYHHSYIDENGKYHAVFEHPPSKQCSSASWTLDQMAGDFASRMEKLVRENNPGWKPGDAFDTSILDQLDGTLSGVDFRA